MRLMKISAPVVKLAELLEEFTSGYRGDAKADYIRSELRISREHFDNLRSGRKSMGLDVLAVLNRKLLREGRKVLLVAPAYPIRLPMGFPLPPENPSLN